MRHTIIACDLCDQRIYRDGWLIEEGAGKPYITELFSAPIEGEADMVRFAEEDDE